MLELALGVLPLAGLLALLGGWCSMMDARRYIGHAWRFYTLCALSLLLTGTSIACSVAAVWLLLRYV